MKKANIPITVLVMLTIGLFVFTLLAFYLSSRRQLDDLVSGQEVVQNVTLSAECYKFLSGDYKFEKQEIFVDPGVIKNILNYVGVYKTPLKIKIQVIYPVSP